MCQKIKTTIRKSWKIVIIALTAIFIANVANAQSQQSNMASSDEVGYMILILILMIVTLLFKRKAKGRKKEYQPVFVEIFNKQDILATDIVWTNCKQIIRRNAEDYIVHNIVFGVKNGVISFFGGGSRKVNFGIENKKVAFYDDNKTIDVANTYNPNPKPKWKKLLKEADDILLSDDFVAKTLFPQRDEKKFKHLFDIPINSIKIEGKERSDRVDLYVEYSGKLITLSPYCRNINMAIQTANTMIETFEKMMNGRLSDTEIYKTNLAVIDAYENDKTTTAKRQLKIIGSVVGTAVAIGGVAAASGAHNWSNDR